VRQVLPARLRRRLAALTFSTVPRPGAASPTSVSPDVLMTLSGAVRAHEVLVFDYPGRRPDTDDLRPPRRVEPHHLVTSGGRWYLVAWDLDHEDWRIFRADRVTPRTPTGPRFAPRQVPGGDAREFVSARFKGSAQADTWPCTGTVVLHLPASAVLPYAGDGTVEDLSPDRCRFTAGSWSWIALAASLNRFDTAVDVVGPPELREAFVALASRNAATAAG
jgi:predicted DNA-binding transcriptional regulator YafY